MMIGWPMLAFGGLLSTVFVGNSEIATWYRFATELATTQGVVVGSEATNMRNNRDEVLLVEFTYSVNAQDYRARSFTQQQPPADDAVVTIEYAVNKPENARIGGMRSAPFPAVAGLTLIVPSVAIVLLLIGYLRGRKKLRLMRDGTSVWGLLTDQHTYQQPACLPTDVLVRRRFRQAVHRHRPFAPQRVLQRPGRAARALGSPLPR
jgi:hypothetical protein